MSEWIKSGVIILIASVVGILATEKGLRWLGHWPFAAGSNDRDEQRVTERDDQRGWKPRIGTWQSAEAGQAQITITAEGRRRDLPDGAKKNAGRRVVFVGDSITMGIGIRDEETFVWRLNQYDPTTRYENHGVAGYGTYQSLLTASSVLERQDIPKPDWVIYGFFDHHAIRNLSPFDDWIMSLSQGAKLGYDIPPHIRLAHDVVVQMPGRVEPRWPFESYSSIITSVHQSWLRIKYHRPDKKEMLLAEEALLSGLRDVARNRGVRFGIVHLASFRQPPDLPNFAEIKAWADAHGVPSVDCWPIDGATPAYRVGGTGHPNAKLHEHYANCILGELTTGNFAK